MKKSFLFISLLISLEAGLYAQKSGNSSNTLTYTPNYDTPHEVAKLTVHFQPLNIMANTWNIAVGAGVEATYRPIEPLGITIFGTMAYADRFGENKAPYGSTLGFPDQIAFCKTGTRSASEVGLTGTYYFKFVEKDKKAYMTLHSDGHARYIARVPCIGLVGYGLRIGLWKTNSWYENQSVSFNGTLVDKTPSLASTPPPTIVLSGAHASTMFSQTILRIGLESLLQENISAKFEGHADKKGNEDRNVRMTKRFYADLLIGVSQNMGNVMIPTYQDQGNSFNGGSNQWYNFREYDVNSNTPKSKAGFLLGYILSSTDGFNLYYGAEGGLMPGPGKMTSNIFLNFKVNFSLSTNKPQKS
jgi:hypothetical protein